MFSAIFIWRERNLNITKIKQNKKIILNPNHNILQSETVNRKCSAAAELSALLQQL